MATYPVYPATTFTQAVELTIFASNQLHDVINGDALTTVETENGDIPTLRKALVDNFYFKTPINWVEGESSTVFNQLYYFGGTLATSGWYYAPQATLDNPIAMGSTPLADDNWRLYQPATQSIPAQVHPWSTEITQVTSSIVPPYEFDTAIVTYNSAVLVPGKDYTIANNTISFTPALVPEPDAEVPDILFCYIGKVEEGNPDTNYVTYVGLAANTAANIIGTSSGETVQDELDKTVKQQNLASGEEEEGDALLAVKQLFEGAVARTQHDKNSELFSLMDAGGDRNAFDPETLELLVKAVANELRIPYLGAQQFALPDQTLKVWKYMDGFKDRGAVASFSSIDTPDSNEPTTQVLGLADASALGKYGDRDTVVLFAQAEGQPPLLATSNTTFTATTVTSPDFATVADKLRRKQIIDVIDANTPSKIYSGWIVAFDPDTNTITIETAWYLKGGNGITTGTPSSGSSLKLVPNTKIWGQNTNVILKATSDATSFAGFELGLYNNKTDSQVGYGYDAYSGGTYTVLNGFQARGKLYCGFRNYAQGDYGYIGGGHQYGYYDSGSERGLFAWNNAYGVNIKSPTSYAIILQDSSNAFITGMDKDGKWQGLKYYTTTVSPGGSISQYSTVAFVTPTAASQTVTLPAPSAGKVIYVRNLSSSYSISCVGAMEGASGAIALAAKTTIQLVSDGTYWYPLSKYSA